MLRTWPEEGGFCILTWVHEAETWSQFHFRVAVFFITVLPASIVLNFSWLAWQALRATRDAFRG